MGFQLANPTGWRTVLYFSCGLSAVQFLLAGLIVESPVWLADKGRLDEKKTAALRLWGAIPLAECRERLHSSHLLQPTERSLIAPQRDLEDPLLDDHRRDDVPVVAVSVPELLTAPDLRRPLIIGCLAMASQQLSGRLCGFLGKNERQC